MLARKELSYVFHFCLEKRSEVPAKKEQHYNFSTKKSSFQSKRPNYLRTIWAEFLFLKTEQFAKFS